MKLKPLHEQVIVVTGGTSGIGLATVRMAAERGARLVIAARNEAALRRVVEEIEAKGAQATFVAADVGREEDVERIKEYAVHRFGGFDTWINDAAVSIYGRLDTVETGDMHRLFDTNFWGQVYGSRAALAHFRERGTPAKLINLGSVLGERAIPIQGIYSASKHAVAGFTEALRVEIDAQRLPVSVTLIKPSAIDTPYKEHAKNYLDEAPKNPPPVYDPRVVAQAILYACEHDRRDIVIGAAGKLINVASSLAPRTADRVMAKVMPYLQRSRDRAGPRGRNALYRPMDDLEETSDYPVTLRSSLYTQASLHPVAAFVALAGAAALASSLLRARHRRA